MIGIIAFISCLIGGVSSGFITLYNCNKEIKAKDLVIDELTNECNELKELNDKLNCDKTFQPFIPQQYESISFHSQITVNHESLFYRDIENELKKNIFDLLLSENVIDINHEYIAGTDKDVFTGVLKCVK